MEATRAFDGDGGDDGNDDDMVALGNRIAETAAAIAAGIHRLPTDIRASIGRPAGPGALSCAPLLELLIPR